MIRIETALTGGTRVTVTNTSWTMVSLNNGAKVKIDGSVYVSISSGTPAVNTSNGALIDTTGNNGVRWIYCTADASNDLYLLSASPSTSVYVFN